MINIKGFFIISFLTVLMVFSSPSFAVNWSNKDQSTIVLSRCEAVYAYLANLSMMGDNESAAKIYLSHSVTLATGNMFLNRESGADVIKAERLRLMKKSKEGMRKEHDENADLLRQRADDCRSVTPQVVNRFGKAPEMWGKNFIEVRDEVLKITAPSIGIF